MNGRKTTPKRSGLMDLNKLEPTCWSMSLPEFNLWTKSENPWKVPSNGPPKNPPWLKNIWEESEWTSTTSSCTLTLSTEEEVKSSPLPEESITLLFWLPIPNSWSLCSWPKSQDPLKSCPESIWFSIKEEVSLRKKSKSSEPQWIWLSVSYPSLKVSDLLLLWEEQLLEKLSPNVFSHTGKSLTVTPRKLIPKPLNLSPRSEPEKV